MSVVPVDQREDVARKHFQPLAGKLDEDTLEYVTMSAASVLQDADSGKAALEELEEALEPHLEEVVSDFKKFVKELVAAVFPEKEKKAKAAAPAAKSAAGTPAKAKASAKNGAAAAKGKAKAKAAAADVALPADEDEDDAEDSQLVCRIPNLILMYGGSQKPLLNNTTFELFRGHRYGVVGHNGAGKTTLMSRISAGGMQGMGSMKCYHLQHEGILDDVDKNTSCSEYVRLKCPNQADKVDKVIKDVGFDAEMYKKAIGELSGGWKMRLALACASLQGADVMLLDEPTNHLDTVAIKWLQEFLVKECQNSTAMVISHDAAFLNYICTDVIHFTAQGKLVYYEGNFDAFKSKAKIGAADAKGVLTVRGREGKIAEGEEETAQDDEEQARPKPEDEEEMKFPLPGKIDGLGTTSKPVATVTNLNFRYFDDTPLVLQEVTCRVTMSSRIGVVGRNGAGKSTLLNLLAGELLPPEDEAGEVSAVWRHRNMRLAYIAQHHFFHLSDFFQSTPLHYMQVRFRNGFDEETQRRLTLPQSPEEEQYRKDMAAKHGKRGKEVETLLARAKKGKKIMYEVKWKGLDDPKQNTYESIQTLRLLGVEKMAAALDDRIACAETALRPLSTREIVKHLEPFGISEHMTCHRMIGSFSAGQKSKLMLAAAMWVKPHIIAFDEPTNYLDFATVRALARAIKLFRGGTIVVTHNEDFLKETCEEIWHVEGGRLNIEGKDGLRKGIAAKVAAQKQNKEKAKLEAEAEKAEKAAAGPSEAEKALAIYLKARQKMGAPKADIKLQGVDLRSKDGTELLISTDFMLNQGRCYGLVGRNGAGKSTLLREVAHYKLDKFPKNLKVLLVEQEVLGDERKPVEWVLDSDVERRTLLAEQRELQQKEGEEDDNSQRLRAIADRLEEIGADEGEARAGRILRGLQFTDELLATSTKNLSGGWRMRVSLASALFARPELLLLDEPTNHLDFPAVLYLEEYLASFKNTCMVVSHDRGFLNNVCSDIVFLNNRRLDYYKGNYENFYNTRKTAKLAQQSAYDAQQREIAHIMEFINKHDLRPKIVAQKESKKKMLDKMEKIEDPEITYGDISTISIRFPAPGALPKPDLIQADRISVGYPDRAPLFERATFAVNLKSRVGILGANGAGKSTLLKVMQSKLVPQSGSINVSRNMKVGTFAQHHVDALDLLASCVDCVQSNYPGMSDQEARNLLGRFGINGDMALRKVVTLSGGQKSRIALAIITYSEPHLIYLDEPTNHLDMETIDALIEAVKNFEGAVVMVSHDQYFLSQVATEFWSVAKGQVKVFRDIAEAKASTY